MITPPPPEIAALIARGRYAPAIEMLKDRLRRERHNAPTRMQLADVLVLAGRAPEAVPVLLDLADEFAADGFATKAIAILKKIEKIDPNRSDVDNKLEALLQASRKLAEPSWILPSRQPASVADTERGGTKTAGDIYEPAAVVFERSETPPPRPPAPPPRPGSETLALWPSRAPVARQPHPPPQPEPLHPEPVLESPSPAAEPKAPAPRAADLPADAALAEPFVDPEPEATPSIQPEHQDDGPILEIAPEDDPEPEIVLEADDVLPVEERREIPLFKSLSDDEAMALIRGLKLITFEAGDPILTQGDEPGSMFILTQGRVKTFIKEPGGRRHIMVRTLGEGEFFGEIAVLSGKPRTATVTASTRCDVLELDAATLESLTKQHPRIREVLEDFFIERVSTQSERMAQGSRPGVTADEPATGAE